MQSVKHIIWASCVLTTSLLASVSAWAKTPGWPQGAETYIIMGSELGNALEMRDWGTGDGARVGQYPVHDGANQRWTLEDQGDDTFLLINEHSHKCLEMDMHDGGNGAELRQWFCWGGAQQRWRLQHHPGGAEIINVLHGKCIDRPRQTGATEAWVMAWDCWRGTNQLWRLERSASQPVRQKQVTYTGRLLELQSLTSREVVEIADWSRLDGAEARLYPGHGGANQRWFLRAMPSGASWIVNAESYKCLEVLSADPAAADARQGECRIDDHQAWRIEDTVGGSRLVQLGAQGCLTRLDATAGNRGLHVSACREGDNRQIWRVAAKATGVRGLLHPPLSTHRGELVDAYGEPSQLRGVNWYGASDEKFIVGGLESRRRDDIALLIAEMGFNSVRLPFSNFMVQKKPIITDPSQVAANPDLGGTSAWNVFLETVAALDRHQIAVVLNNHTTQPVWCCGPDPCDTKWFNTDAEGCAVSLDEEGWIRDWEFVVRELLPYRMVVGVDLRNEIRAHGVDWRQWQRAATRAGNRLHRINPDLLIVVEGLGYGQDLTGAREHPVELERPHRLMYSTHAYGWFGFNAAKQFENLDFPSFLATMDNNWGYLSAATSRTATPVYISEFGVGRDAAGPSANYWKNMVRLIDQKKSSFSYWALNPRKPIGDEESFSFIEPSWDRSCASDGRLVDLQNARRHGM